MKKTRNLFLLVGNPTDVHLVLEVLQYKGLVSIPYGTSVTYGMILEHFHNNKSVACSVDDIAPDLIKEGAIFINVIHAEDPFLEVVPNTIIVRAYFAEIERQFEDIVAANNCDVGDHRLNTSDSAALKSNGCVYCRYMSGDYGENAPMVYKSKNFFVFPGSGQFVHGYLMVIPYSHIMSNAELSLDVLEELENVLDDLEIILKLTYGCKNILVWENGSGKSAVRKAKDSIVHSHVHIAISDRTAQDIKEISGFPFDTITLSELANFQKNAYLLVRNADKKTWIINDNTSMYIPRQYIRQIVADEFHVPGELWNWRIHPFYENAFKTADDMIATIKRNWDNLPERIRANTQFLFEKN